MGSNLSLNVRLLESEVARLHLTVYKLQPLTVTKWLCADYFTVLEGKVFRIPGEVLTLYERIFHGNVLRMPECVLGIELAILKGGIRKKNQAPKYVFGFKIFDYVKLSSGEYGFIFGRRSSGSFDVRHLGGKKISAGISYNKFLAKIASDYRKPDGLCTIHPDQALEFIAHLPIESFWGVGKVTAQKMHALGIHKGKDLQPCSLEMLTRLFGKAGQIYYDFARGIDLRPVEATRIRKSVGCEHTLEKDITRTSSVIIELYHVATELVERLKRNGFSGNTLTLKIKFYDFKQITRSLTQEKELSQMADILPLAKQLLKEVDYSIRPIRLIGLSISNPKEERETHEEWKQMELEFGELD